MGGYFEGWYFKQEAGGDAAALIPAVHTDASGRRTGSIQVITPDRAWYIPFPGEAMRIRRHPLVIRAGESAFSQRGINLNIKSNALTAVGKLRFGSVKPPRGDIMGPFQYIPFMECRHSVFSMTHPVSGSLMIDDRLYDFSGGVGYMEGDRGRSFPKRYAWVQCSWDDGGPCALMLSAADVRLLGMPFIGVIGFVYRRGRELRIATYRGARAVIVGGGVLVVEQDEYTLTVRLLDDSRRTLRAPSSGEMIRPVKESLTCRARLTLVDRTGVIFDFITEQASFEFEF